MEELTRHSMISRRVRARCRQHQGGHRADRGTPAPKQIAKAVTAVGTLEETERPHHPTTPGVVFSLPARIWSVRAKAFEGSGDQADFLPAFEQSGPP